MPASDRPTELALAAFGAPDAAIELLPGGRGRTWRAGAIVLRPSEADAEVSWKAEVLSTLAHTEGFRAPRPVRALAGSWAAQGWEAWEWLPGAADESRVRGVLQAGGAFHRAVAALPRPGFLDAATDAWSRADRIAWQEDEVPARATLRRLVEAFAPVSAPSQIVHGDLLGNVLFADRLPPTIIDWAPYWRPVEYASAIVLADAACWHGLSPARLEQFLAEMPNGPQCLIRALVFRIATFELLGMWDEAMERRYAATVAVALRAAAGAAAG
ncbi:phosphotransferase [Microbacterium sp. H1-D42]|uniref:phosphotransferase n=1 Tax=Microbacterium sp. H1-D42 TaxID=2925844 RepID=UPI001F52FB8A|nr:phosphotransferase [Microbacterium sp. H1-D42]UNK71899.1 phosphotransferase [Microbacterium sp. H1-D42]